MVGVGPFDVQLMFEKGDVIQSTYKIGSESNGQFVLWFDNKWLDTSRLKTVSGQEVRSIAWFSATEIKIMLTKEITLSIFTDESLYESASFSAETGTVDIY